MIFLHEIPLGEFHRCDGYLLFHIFLRYLCCDGHLLFHILPRHLCCDGYLLFHILLRHLCCDGYLLFHILGPENDPMARLVDSSSSAHVLWWVLAFPHSWTRKRPYGKTCWFKLSRVQKKTCWLKLSRVAPPAEWTVFFQWQSVRTGWLKTQIKGDYNTIDFGVFLKEPGRTADPMLHIQQFATDSHMILASASFLTNSGSNCRVAECWSPK